MVALGTEQRQGKGEHGLGVLKRKDKERFWGKNTVNQYGVQLLISAFLHLIGFCLN